MFIKLFKKGDTNMFNNFFVITGGPGGGKTTLINELKKRGYFCIEEVARQIIQDEFVRGGDALPWKNVELFKEKMLLHSTETYQQALNEGRGITIFDRGILDVISYSHLTKTPISHELHHAANSLLYNKITFVAPPWEEIYCNDKERKQTFEEAIVVYHMIVKVYSEYGCNMIELPKTDVESRADFVLKHMEKSAER